MGCLRWGLAGAALLTSTNVLARDEHCSTVSGKYSIYANGDRLHVTGSRHLLVVVIDALDKKLEKAGWENSAVYGDFTVCSSKAAEPLELTNRDVVSVKAYSNIRVVRQR